MKAFFQTSLPERAVKCGLCRHQCLIKAGKRGLCGVRENRKGTLYSLVYGRLIARNVDPIEKKPLFHYYPHSRSYSVATVGCNFKCRFCQNADIAQMPLDRSGMIVGDEASPEAVVKDALASRCKSISYTYTEPTVFFEFAYDTARRAHEQGLGNVFVTNGYMSADALEMIAPFLDAANVDLKAFSEDFYRRACGAKLSPVLKTLMKMRALGILVEVTTLLIPGMNDDDDQLHQLASFIRDKLGAHTPWHISRFHPTYRLTDRSATPLSALQKAKAIGLGEGLSYVYMGNVPGQGGEDTLCPECGAVVIGREGFFIRKYALSQGRCRVCGAQIYGEGLD